MATYNEIIYNLRNLYRGGLSSDDDPISDRQLLFIFNNQRAFLIHQKNEIGRYVNRKLIQDLGCVEMECVDAAECCEIVNSGSSILKSKKSLPAFLNKNGTPMITFVGTIDKLISFQLSNRAQTTWAKYNKFTSKSPKVFIGGTDDHLYGVNLPKGIEFLAVQGVLNQPHKIEDFINCPKDICFSLDDEYPIGEELIPVVNDLVIQKDMRLLVTSKQDRVNDTKPEEEEAS